MTVALYFLLILSLSDCFVFLFIYLVDSVSEDTLNFLVTLVHRLT